MHVERTASLQMDVACVRSVCVCVHFEQGYGILHNFEPEEIGT